MTHEIIKHLLDDYVTDDLPDEARAPIAEHIAACELCRSGVEALKMVVARAKELPGSIDPPPEAWSSIRATIVRDQSVGEPERSALGGSLRRRGYLVAAAVVLAAVLSSAGTAWYLNAHNPGVNSSSTAATINSSPGTPATLAAFAVEENEYLRTASQLQDLLEQQEGSLAPGTVAQLRASLRTIDDAITEARNALARDPANKLLEDMLSANYRHKVDLLRRTTEMTRGT